MTELSTEFPKALYKQGVYMAVSDAQEEAVWRAQDWTDYVTDKERTEGRQVPVVNGDTSREPESVLEHKEYSDGTTATGTAPLPEQSPAEQDESSQTAAQYVAVVKNKGGHPRKAK